MTPQVGHIRHPRPGVPYAYIGRTMNRFHLKDVGWGNPYRAGVNTADPVTAYDRYLDMHPELLARLPELVGKDLLCWCRGPGMENDGTRLPWICHGDPILARVLRMMKEAWR